MNINDYRKAMDHINPNNELKERIMHNKAPQKRYVPVYRILASTLAAVLMLTCAASVALAASPELRTAVLSFFHIKEREQMPDQTDNIQPDTNQPDISQAEIGSLVKAQYIKMDQSYGRSGDLFNNLTWKRALSLPLTGKVTGISTRRVLVGATTAR